MSSVVDSQYYFIASQFAGNNAEKRFPNSGPGIYSTVKGNVITVYNIQESDLQNLELYASPSYSSSQINFKVIDVSLDLRYPTSNGTLGVMLGSDITIPGVTDQAQFMLNSNLALVRISRPSSQTYNPFTPINDNTLGDYVDHLTNSELFHTTTPPTYGYVKCFSISFLYSAN
jgi:hypothetical protein